MRQSVAPPSGRRNPGRGRAATHDAQQLRYADDSFDDVVATFLFCSVPVVLEGLHEAKPKSGPE